VSTEKWIEFLDINLIV